MIYPFFLLPEKLKLRLKFGLNPYSQEFRCSMCGKTFNNHKVLFQGLFLRLKVNEKFILYKG